MGQLQCSSNTPTQSDRPTVRVCNYADEWMMVQRRRCGGRVDGKVGMCNSNRLQWMVEALSMNDGS